jgi:2-deoxy-D-gluconate 3-dehydrogenase
MSILDAFSLKEKVALVTGSNRGLGQGMAISLAEAGAEIAGLGHSEDSQETRSAIEQLGRRFIYYQVDLRQATPDNLREVVNQVIRNMGRLDILINNAGVIRRSPSLDFSEKDWDDVIHVNLKSLFFLTQAAGKVMVDQRSGKVINIASMLSFQGGILVPSYTASKSGVAGLTRLLANEWAAKGVNVNAIAPGYIATSSTAALREDPVRNQQILTRIPAGRWGTPDDLKGAVVFLASDAANYLHGTILVVDGGWLSR